MSRIVCYFLAASMCISMVTCLTTEYAEIPPAVNDRDTQCVLKGLRGACTNYMWENNEVDCSHLQCASQFTTAPKVYIRTEIGLADNGTRCGLNSVCFMGRCRDLPSHISMPKQIGRIPYVLNCQKPHRLQPAVYE